MWCRYSYDLIDVVSICFVLGLLWQLVAFMKNFCYLRVVVYRLQLQLNIFSGTFLHFLASRSESSAHESKVVPGNCVLCHKCADMCTTSLLSLCCVCVLLAVTQMVSS